MKKNKKVFAILLLAVLLAAIACMGIYIYLNPQRATIYVFRDDYTAGTQITKDLLMPVQVDATIVEMGTASPINKQYVTSDEYTQVLQDASTLKWDVSKGTSLMKSMLTAYGGSKVEIAMKPSSIALTVPADYLTAVTNELSSGSRVNVYASYDSTGAETVLLLQNVRVLTAPKTAENMIVGVTLEVDHEQSLMLVHAATYGSVYFGLVDEMGYQYTDEDQPRYDVSGFSVGANAGAKDE